MVLFQSLLKKENIAVSGWINAGVYKFERVIFENFGFGFLSLETDVLPQLVVQENCSVQIGR